MSCALVAGMTMQTNQIEVKKTTDGFVAIINGKPIMQFERPTQPYVFSSAATAEQAAKQQKA